MRGGLHRRCPKFGSADEYVQGCKRESWRKTHRGLWDRGRMQCGRSAELKVRESGDGAAEADGLWAIRS